MRLSTRSHFAAAKSPLARWLASRAPPAIDLSESNPTRCGLEQPEAVALLGDRSGARYAPDPRGARATREAIARYYARRGAAIDPDRIVLTASSSEGYGWLFKLLCDPGDVVLGPTPSYPLFPFLAKLESVHLLPYRLAAEERWRIDRGDLERAIDARTRAILAVSPANPTGHYLEPDDAAFLEALAHDRSLALVIDEVFHDFHLEPPPPSFATRTAAPAFILSGLSKVALLPQLKLGWIVASDSEALGRLEMIGDTYLSVASAVERAAPAILDGVDVLQARLRQRLHGNLALLDAAIARLGADCPVRRLPVGGGWYSLVEIPRTRSDEAWVRHLVEREDVLSQPGYFYDIEADGVMVVSLLLEPAVFAEAIARAVACWAEG